MTEPNITIAAPMRKLSAWGASAANDERGECSSTTLALARADLARSGLTLDDARACGIFAVDDASSMHPHFAAHPALVIPYWRADGSLVTYEQDGVRLPMMRVRYLSTLSAKPLPKGDQRYDNPKGAGVQIYYPPSYDWSRFERGEVEDVCAVEGEKKAAALCKAGIPCIAIGGVWNTRQSGTKSLHPDLANFPAKNFRLLFDSDIATNEHVQQAEIRLASHLGALGKRVFSVRLPMSDEMDAAGKPLKVGADDYLVSHGAAALTELILSTPALGEREATLSGEGVLTIADLLKHDVQPVEELIPGWLEKGIPTFLCGPGGVHKSRLALQWGLALNVNASPWGGQFGGGQHKFGEPPPTRVSLVYVSAEDDANELARRVQAICRELKLQSPDSGQVLSRKGKDSALAIMRENGEFTLTPFYYELRARLSAIRGHKLVVLDSAYDIVRFVGKAKIDEDSVNLFIKQILQGICDQTDSTLLITWHPSQAGSSREEMNGWSVAWRNAPRARLALDKATKEDEFELRVEKRNHAAKATPITLRFHQGALLPIELAPKNEHDADALRRVAVKWAKQAGAIGAPITMQRRIPLEALREAEAAVGRAVKEREFKEELQRAALAGDLYYVQGNNRHTAGYYEGPEDLARELAKRLKHGAAVSASGGSES